MDDKLYYCEYWEKKYYHNYTIVISDIIYVAKQNSMQLHIIAMDSRTDIVRICDVDSIKEFEKT